MAPRVTHPVNIHPFEVDSLHKNETRIYRAIPIIGLLSAPMLSGCGSDVMARLLGQEEGVSPRPIAVDAWEETAHAQLPSLDSPFGPSSLLEIDDRQGLRIETSVDAPDEIQTYALGPMSPGDRISIQAVPLANSRLDPVVAIFDAEMNWVHYNDDRHYYNRQIDALIDFVSTTYSDDCFVVVASSPRAESVGELDLFITRETGNTPRPPARQAIYLEFEGQSNVVIGRRNPVNVPAFDASSIAEELAGYTDVLIEGVTARVRADFAPFNVPVYSSRYDARPSIPHTTIYFGSEDPGLLGLSDSIDTQNKYDVQEAIVFVDSFDLFLAASPTTQEWVDVLANVASHEIGHLLGLHHTADPREIMDTTADLVQMLKRQTFHRARLHDETFAVGYQDSVGTLGRNVGYSSGLQPKAVSEPLATDGDVDYEPTTPARWFCEFGTACASELTRNRVGGRAD